MYLSVIIPAYNEEKRLGRTISSVEAYLKVQAYQYEIIVVNDGSKDGTANLVRQHIQTNPNLRLIDYKKNRGKGYAVHEGMLTANGDLRLFMDADGSTSIDQIDKMLPYLVEGYSVVISSRRVYGAQIKVEQKPHRLFLGWVFRNLVESIVPLKIRDSQNGFKLFTRTAAKEIFSKQTIFRWAFDVEVLYLARKFGFKIKEVPVVWENDNRSKVTFLGMVYMLLEVISIRFKRY